MRSRDFVVLMVCTGNMYRSPAAELLLRQRLGPGSGIRLVSAGTRPVPGLGVAAPMARLLAAEGIDLSGFKSRVVDEGSVHDADLVLGMTREHRASAVSLWPGAVRGCFTLKESARLLEHVDDRHLDAVAAPTPADRLAALTELAGRRRTPAAPEADDIPDPDSGPSGTTLRAFTEVKDAVERIAARLLA